MSFEDTPTQVVPAVSNTPVKKRGRPAGVKNKKTVAKKPVAKDATVNALAHKLSYAELHINKLEDDYKKLRQRYKMEVDGLMSIISYLEATLKETWQKEAIDAASV
jgi:predicted RNase H-like nuclease (RuvC/YqgF family)